MKRWVQALISFSVITLLSPSPGFGVTARIVNISEMVASADRIFRGRCLSVEPAGSAAGLPVLQYTFEVVEGLKGVTEGEQVAFRQVQGAGKDRRKGVAGIPGYRGGEEVLLFLYPDSQLGLTSPVGLDQGVFRVIRDDSGEIQVVNALLNRNLTQGLSEDVRPVAFGGKVARLLEEGGPLPLERLRLAVDQISRQLEGKAKSIQ